MFKNKSWKYRFKNRILEVVKAAKDYNCSIRIGVNAGSLEKKFLEKYKEPCPEALVESAMYNVKLFEDNDFYNFKISVKSSDIFLAIKSYEMLSDQCDYPLHLGITEAGGLINGKYKILNWNGTLINERYWRHNKSFSFCRSRRRS